MEHRSSSHCLELRRGWTDVVACDILNTIIWDDDGYASYNSFGTMTSFFEGIWVACLVPLSYE